MDVHISTPDGAYEILPVSDGIYSLQELDLTEVSDVGCAAEEKRIPDERTARKANEHLHDSVSSDPGAREASCGTQTNPRVLILYGANTLIYAGGVTEVNNRAAASVAQFNQAILNSGINSQAQLILAGTVFPPQPFVEGPFVDGTLENLISDPNINALRDSYQADIVVYFSTIPPSFEYEPPRGVAGYPSASYPDITSDRAYTVVQFYAAVANKTFAHEVGHLFGCWHDNPTVTPTPEYARGYNIRGFLGIIVDRTLMSMQTGDGKNRLVHFSNPDISVSGRATGEAGHDNARRIDETWNTVAGFRSNPPNPPSAFIEGASYVTSTGPQTYELVHSCFVGPYSFQWQISNDGFNYTNAPSTSDTYTYVFHHAQTLHLRCLVSPYSYYAYYTVTAVMEEAPERIGFFTNYPLYGSHRIEENLRVPANTSASAYPNPSSGIVNIPFHIPESSSKVSLKIIDLTGRIIKVIINNESLLAAGDYIEKWDAVNMPAGAYRYILEINNEVKSGSILIEN